MRVPNRIEWHVGVVLFLAAGVLIGLFATLVVFRMDVGVEIAGVLDSTEDGMVLRIALPERHLGYLSRCSSVRIDEAGQRWYGDIRTVAASWMQDTGLVAEIFLHDEDMPGSIGPSPRDVRGMLVESRQMKILKVLLQSLYNHKDLSKNAG